MRWLRVLAVLVAVPLVLLMLAAAASIVLSPPGRGKQLAERLHVPYKAVIAHRGASWLAPESTTPAYLLAAAMGVDYLEADLRRTADGVIVVFHDDTLAEKTNVAAVFPGRENDPVETFTYDELMQLDAGSWFNDTYPDRARPSFAGLRILTLQELVDIAQAAENKPGLYLETKSVVQDPRYEEEIVRILREAGLISGLDTEAASTNEPHRAPVIFQSFYPASLTRLKTLAPDVPRVLLISLEAEAEHGWAELMAVAETEADAVGPIGFLAWPWNVGAAHRAGLVVHPYVINMPWQMRLLSFFGVDGLFTDAPHVALPVYARRAAVDVADLFEAIGY